MSKHQTDYTRYGAPPFPRIAVVLTVFAMLMGALASACAIAARNDLAGVSPGRVGFDDMCHVQPYFDTLAAGRVAAPEVVAQNDILDNEGRVVGGRQTIAFSTAFQREHLVRVLRANWRSIPGDVERADRLLVEVLWAERSGVHRVVTNADAQLVVEHGVEGAQPKRIEYPLGYHVCLSELLFGEPLYRQRRDLLLSSTN